MPKGAPPNSTYLASNKPIPKRYSNGTVAIKIRVVSVDEANRYCAGGVPICRRVFYACVRDNVLTMPNPCEYPQDDSYARLLCHETAHLRGWPAWHGD